MILTISFRVTKSKKVKGFSISLSKRYANKAKFLVTCVLILRKKPQIRISITYLVALEIFLISSKPLQKYFLNLEQKSLLRSLETILKDIDSLVIYYSLSHYYFWLRLNPLNSSILKLVFMTNPSIGIYIII